MRHRNPVAWTLFALLVAACGGSGTTGDVPADGELPDGVAEVPDVPGPDARDDAAVLPDGWIPPDGCLDVGQPCTDPTQCCGGVCYRGFCSTTTGTCEAAGEECIAPSDCCSGRCETEADGVRRCQNTTCTPAGEACEAAYECCSLYCLDGACAEDGRCAQVGDPCEEALDCCSNVCTGGACQASAGLCLPLGEACGAGTCCSRQCETLPDGDTMCVGNYTCRPPGEICRSDDECCTMSCDRGVCMEFTNCAVVGIPCTGFRECCSGACVESGVGTPTCQYLSGCRPVNEICFTDDDCCSGGCQPSTDDPEVFRCHHPAGCLGDGEVCFTGSANNCCSGRRNCRPTLAGVSRCYAVPEGECIADGQACTFNDECCCGLCAADASGARVCCPGGITCVPVDGPCTADVDCCDGYCVAGSCTSDERPCVPYAGPCTTDADCCSDYCDPATHVCTAILF
ncbi:MAG: hypothetical protein GYA57_07215 [Myxococcales bacterium]|nr:hypothetical protein [Myxococcales bacterium]